MRKCSLMKLKTFCIISLPFIFWACTNKPQPPTAIGGADKATGIFVSGDGISNEETLCAKGIQLTKQLHGLANDSDYIRYLSRSPKVNEQIDRIGNKDYTHPRKTFAISNLQGNLTDLLSQSSYTKRLLIDRLIRSIPSRLNAQSGSDVLAATSLLTIDDVFFYKGKAPNEYTLYLYLYEDSCHSMVLYRPGKDGIMQATANVVIHPQLDKIETADDVKYFFAQYLDIPEAEVRE